jgi:hypothetical protein
MRAIVEGLKARGYIEGRNLTLDRRSRFGLDSQGRDDSMADIVRLKPDVIIVDGTGDAVRAIKLTSNIPDRDGHERRSGRRRARAKPCAARSERHRIGD